MSYALDDAPVPPEPPTIPAPPAAEPRLLDQVLQGAAAAGHEAAAQDRFAHWTRWLVLFHGKRHPRELSRADLGRLLEHVVRAEKVPLAALTEARRALDFLYRDVLALAIDELPLPRPPRLLDQLRQALRLRLYAQSTEESYVDWIRRFILLHGRRHPRELGAEVERCLTHLAVDGHVATSTQNQALNALVFLHQQVLEIDLSRIDAARARRPKRLRAAPHRAPPYLPPDLCHAPGGARCGHRVGAAAAR